MNKILFGCILLLFSTVSLFSQKTVELDSVEMEVFEKEAIYTYKVFLQSVLNIIDDRLPLEDRYLSRALLIDLFANQSSTQKLISDIISTRGVEKKSPSEYSWALLEAEKKLPIFYKKIKTLDDFDFNGTVASNDILPDSLYTVYFGDLFALEKLISSRKLSESLFNNETYNAFENGLLKRMTFRLGKSADWVYELKIKSIRIIEQKDKDYKPITTHIEESSSQWSDVANQYYIDQMVEEAFAEGIELLPRTIEEIPIDSSEIALLIGKDTTTFEPVQFRDYIIPGIGHMKFDFDDNKNSRKFRTGMYLGLFAGTLGYATYNRIRSNSFYDKHQSSVTLRDSDINYDKANRFHKQYLFGVGAACLTVVGNAVHLKIMNQIQIRRINEAKGGVVNPIGNRESVEFELGFIDSSYGSLVGLQLQF